jgi:DNA/RNA endonuclease G (NUC1)
MKKTILLFAIVLCQVVVFAQDRRERALEAYLQVKEALVRSDSKAAQAAAKDFHREVSGMEGGQKTLTKAAAKLAKQTDLEKQRKAFEVVSIMAWNAVKNSAPMNQSLIYQYCPMKNAYWISNEETIRNPYYGSQMLDCGKVSEKIDAK